MYLTKWVKKSKRILWLFKFLNILTLRLSFADPPFMPRNIPKCWHMPKNLQIYFLLIKVYRTMELVNPDDYVNVRCVPKEVIHKKN